MTIATSSSNSKILLTINNKNANYHNEMLEWLINNFGEASEYHTDDWNNSKIYFEAAKSNNVKVLITFRLVEERMLFTIRWAGIFEIALI